MKHNDIVRAIPTIGKLWKLSMSQLRKKNKELHHAYNGPNMTKAQLIMQITFHRDA